VCVCDTLMSRFSALAVCVFVCVLYSSSDAHLRVDLPGDSNTSFLARLPSSHSRPPFISLEPPRSPAWLVAEGKAAPERNKLWQHVQEEKEEEEEEDEDEGPRGLSLRGAHETNGLLQHRGQRALRYEAAPGTPGRAKARQARKQYPRER